MAWSPLSGARSVRQAALGRSGLCFPPGGPVGLMLPHPSEIEREGDLPGRRGGSVGRRGRWDAMLLGLTRSCAS